MTDLTGAELALAVAQVTGKNRPKLWEQSAGEMTCVRTDECSGLLYEWRPDQGGAAAWEVLEWVRGRGLRLELSTRPNGDCVAYLYRDVEDDASAYGPTDAIALCRAVVALGETG